MSKRQLLILGPPGTGKTHFLLDTLDQELSSGVNPERIAFLSFTKRAVEEARHRAMERFNLDKDDLPWFRTLHSLAFGRLGLRRDEVMQSKHYRELGEALGLTFSSRADVEDGMPTGHHLGDRYTFLDGFARSRCLTPDRAWRECVGDADEVLNEWEFKRYRETLREYKHSRNLVDFTDMLELPQSPLDVDVVIVDEAQDLSTLQWDYLRRVVVAGARRIYIAGDDDQAIYQWSGADVDAFQAQDGQRVVLHQSHRVPSTVHKVAERIVSHIHHRYTKTYSPRDLAGSVQYHMEPDSVDLTAPGSWLLLVRNGHLMPALVGMVRAQGFAYSLRGESALNHNHIQAIVVYERWRRGGELGPEDAELLASLGFTGKVPDRIWHEALRKIPILDREWYISMLRRGESLTKKPRINISTIHGVKGGEADNVVLVTDMSARTWHGYQNNPDAEHRVWYVGATRTKNHLHIVQPQGRMYYDV